MSAGRVLTEAVCMFRLRFVFVMGLALIVYMRVRFALCLFFRIMDIIGVRKCVTTRSYYCSSGEWIKYMESSLFFTLYARLCFLKLIFWYPPM